MDYGFSYEEFFSEKEETPPPKKLKGILSLLKESFRFYFSNFKFIWGVLGLPLGLFLLLFNISYISNFTSLKYSFALTVFKFLLGIFSSLLLLTSSLALIQSFEEEISVRDAYKRGLRLLPAYLWLLIILSLIEIGGFVLGFIPGVIFQIWFSLAVFVFVLENLKGFQALLRSKQLVKGKFWAVFLRLLILGIIFEAISMGLRFLATSEIDYIPLSNFVDTIINVSLQIFLFPIFLFYIYLIYRGLKEIKVEEPVGVPSLGTKAFYGIFAFVGAIPFLFLFSWLTFNVFWGRDIPGFDDSDLRLGKIEIPKEQNALFDVLEAINKRVLIKEPFYSKLYDDMMIGNKLSTKEARRLMEMNEESFRIFQQALGRPYLQLLQVQDPKEFNGYTQFSELSKMRELARWGRVRADYLFFKGKEREAFEWYMNVIKLGQMVENSPRPAGLIQSLVAIAIREIGLAALRKRIGKEHLPAGELKRYARELEKLAGNNEGLKRSFKMEYIYCRNFFSQLESLLWSKRRIEEEGEQWFGGMPAPEILFYRTAYFKPKKAQLLQAEFYRCMIRNLDKPFKEMDFSRQMEREREEKGFEELLEESKEPSLLEEIKFLFQENVVGKKLIDLLTPSMKNVFSTFCRVKFSTEATAVLLALRAYQKEKGRLPDSLKELVPEYLSRLPLDPFDGKPLRYSKEKKIVYCVGRDLVDSGGNREWGFWGNWKDPGFLINF